jgi:hypothetical protein
MTEEKEMNKNQRYYILHREVETQASPHPSTYIISIHKIVLPCNAQFKTIFSA